MVVGGGPAGIAAAVHAAEAGARTLLVDEQPCARRPGLAPPRRAARRPRDPGSSASRARAPRCSPEATVVDATGRELLVEHEGRPGRVALRAPRPRDRRARALPPLPRLDPAGRRRRGRRAGPAEGGRPLRGRRASSWPARDRSSSRSPPRSRGPGRGWSASRSRRPCPRLAAFGAGLWREPSEARRGPRLRARRSPASPYRAGAWVREAVGREAVEARPRSRTAGASGAGTATCWPAASASCRASSCRASSAARRRTTASSWTRRSRRAVPGVYAAGELLGIAGADRALTTGAIAGLAAAGPAGPRGARRAARAGERLRLAPDPRLRAARRAAGPRPPRHDRLPLRGRRASAAWPRPPRSARRSSHTRAGMGPCQGRVCGPALSLPARPASGLRAIAARAGAGRGAGRKGTRALRSRGQEGLRAPGLEALEVVPGLDEPRVVLSRVAAETVLEPRLREGDVRLDRLEEPGAALARARSRIPRGTPPRAAPRSACAGRTRAAARRARAARAPASGLRSRERRRGRPASRAGTARGRGGRRRRPTRAPGARPRDRPWRSRRRPRQASASAGW